MLSTAPSSLILLDAPFDKDTYFNIGPLKELFGEEAIMNQESCSDTGVDQDEALEARVADMEKSGEKIKSQMTAQATTLAR